MAFSAWLAFTVATSLHIGNAFWAAMPIWAVAQPTRGLMLERAVFRVLGTLLGALVGFAILAWVSNPYLQLILLALWVTPCAAFTHVLRGVHGYGSLLSGITAGVVVLSTIFAPDNSLAVAAERVMCTLIGVVVVTVVMWVFTPASTPGLHASYRKLNDLCAQALALAASRFALGGPRHGVQAAENKVVAALSAVESTATMAAAGLAKGYRLSRYTGAMVTATLEILAVARQQARRGIALSADQRGVLESLAQWLTEPSGAALPTMLKDWATGRQPIAGDVHADTTRLSRALAQLTRAAAALREMPDLPPAGGRLPVLVPARDWVLARQTGMVAGLATLGAGVLGYLSGGPTGELAALGVCIFSMVLGSMPMPQQIAPKLLLGVTVGACVAAFYRLGVQPGTTEMPWLVLALVPFLLLGGLARASRVSRIPAMDGNMCFLLGSQAGMAPAANVAEVFAGSGSLILGAVVVACGFIWIPRRPDRLARQEAALIAADLEALAHQAVHASSRSWPDSPMTARRILRLARHVSYARHVEGRHGVGSPLAALNLGQSIKALGEQLRLGALTEENRVVVVTALDELTRMRADPRGVSAQVRVQAGVVADPAIGNILMDVADAVDDLRGLWRLARV